MTKLEMVAIAMQELSGGSAADWTAFVETTYGEKISPNFIPVYVASIKDKAKLDAARQVARAAAAELAAAIAAKDPPEA